MAPFSGQVRSGKKYLADGTIGLKFKDGRSKFPEAWGTILRHLGKSQ